jgi:hypothetical protein
VVFSELCGVDGAGGCLPSPVVNRQKYNLLRGLARCLCAYHWPYRVGLPGRLLRSKVAGTQGAVT